jgi:signal transduction histidine kinase/ligand-binding sensor domain-containing protein
MTSRRRNCVISGQTIFHYPIPKKRGIVLFGMSLMLCAALFAQDRLLPVFHFNRLTTADGLPTNEIRSNVVRDRQGFLWVGTNNGLARYDGYTTRVYHEFSGSDNAITLHIDSKGRFWIGKYASGLSLYDPVKDRFINFLSQRSDSSSFHSLYVGTIFEDEYGIIWLGTEDAVVSLNLGDAAKDTNADSVARHARFQTIQSDGFKGVCSRVVRWDDTSLMVSSLGGMFIVNRHTGKMSRPGLPTVGGLHLDTLPAHTLFRESPTRLWIGTVSHGLYLLDQTSGSLTGYHKRRDKGERARDSQIQELQQDRNGTIWIATGDGVDMFDPVAGAYREYIPNSVAPGKSMFTRMSVDSSGTLWIGTADDGLYYLSPASFRFPHYALRGPSGLPMEMETIDAGGDGSYWVGAEGKVVLIRLADLKVLRIVDLLQGEKSRYARTGFWASYDDGKGTLWYGTWGLGLYSFEPQTGRVNNFRSSRQLNNLTFREDVCRSLVSGARDTLWIAAYDDGLLSFDMRRHTFSSLPHDVRGQVEHLMKDRSGKIWISDEFLGLFAVDPSTHQKEFFLNNPTDSGSLSNFHPQLTYQDPQGRIWIGSKDLHRWEPESRSLKPVVNDKFADATIVYPLGSDRRGRLWVYYARNGLGILDPHTNTFVNFDYSDGLFSLANMSLLPDGRVMLIGGRGMIIVDPDSIYGADRAPLLVLSRVSVSDTVNILPKNFTAALQLPYDQNVLEFEFAAIDPGRGHQIEYLYRMEGLEDHWIHPAARRFVRYPGVEPGNYTFRVKAISKLGRWPDLETTLAISISPPWWLTWWSKTLAAVIFLGLFIFIYKREVTRLRKDKRIQQEFSRRQIESQEADRKRLAAELHDGLGQDLLVVSNELQQFLQEGNGSREDLKQAAALVQESIQTVREISSNLHPHHLDRLGFNAALEAMAENVSHSTGLIIHRVCDKIDRLLPKETEIHVYRIIQEALANVVRHASAHNVSIGVKKNKGFIEITVSDDGRGFDVNNTLQRWPSRPSGEGVHGFGLSSMAERVRIIGGKMKIESAAGSGTALRVTVPYS